MVFNYLLKFHCKDTEQNDIFCAGVFFQGLAAGHYLPFPYGLHPQKSINNFHMKIVY